MDAACPKCQSPLQPGLAFCSKCGQQVSATAEDRQAIGDRLASAHARQQFQKNIDSGRNVILAVAIITAVFGTLLYFLKKNQVEDQIRKAEANMQGV